MASKLPKLRLKQGKLGVRVQLVAPNGEPQFLTEPYADEKKALRGIDDIKKNLEVAEIERLPARPARRR